MKRTFVDSGVLIAAARGNEDVARQAMAVLDDPEREFASSPLVKLEVLPNTTTALALEPGRPAMKTIGRNEELRTDSPG